MIEIGLGVGLIVSNVLWLVFYLKAKKTVIAYREAHPNAANLAAVCHDLNRMGVGMLEVTRVDPGSVFLYGTRQ